MEMIKLSNQKKKAVTVRAVDRDVVKYRIVAFTVALIVAVLTVMILQNSNVATVLAFYNHVNPVLIPLFALGAAGAVALWVSRVKRGVDESREVFSASMLTVLSGGYFLACVGYVFFSPTRLLICLIAASALFYIYYLYPRTFFAYSALTLCAGILLSFVRFGVGVAGLIVPAILLVALEVLIFAMIFGAKGAPAGLVPADFRARVPFLLTAAIVPVGLVLGLLAPSMLFYAIVILFASFLVTAIIQTLKMM